MTTRRFAGISMSFASLMLVTNAEAEGVPQQLWYQGRLLDSNNQPVQGTRSIKFEIFDAPESGTSLWSDTLNIGVVDGLYAVALGSTQDHPFPMRLFDGGLRFLEISVEHEKLAPRQAFGSVPFALRAQELANGKAPIFIEAETTAQTDGVGAPVADATTSAGKQYTALAIAAKGGSAWKMTNSQLAKLGVASWGMQGQAVTARIKVTSNLSDKVLARFYCGAKRADKWVDLASLDIVPNALPQNEWAGIRLTCVWTPDDADTFVGFGDFTTGITDLSIDWVESVRQHTGVLSGSIQPPQWSYSATGPVTSWKPLWEGTAVFPSDSLVNLSLMGHWMVDKGWCYATILVDDAPLSNSCSSANSGCTGATHTALTSWSPIGFSVPTAVGAGRHKFSVAVVPTDGTICSINGARLFYGAVAR